VVFPLLKVHTAASYLLKFAVGILLCLIAKKKNGGGRVATSAILFFIFSFALGGMLLAVYSVFSSERYTLEGGYLVEKVPTGFVVCGAVVFAAASVYLIKKLYRRSRLKRFIYPCKVVLGEREIKAAGFLDSGNRATAKGRPLCFLSPDLVYELLGEKSMTEETTILTVSGEKKVKIFLADRIEIYCGKKANIIEGVYCAPSVHIRARDYKIILYAWQIEG
jgi:uncharacterized membrane protein